MTINEIEHKADWYCNHPHFDARRDNTCPTRLGNCEKCRHCMVRIPASAYQALIALAISAERKEE